MLKQVVTVCLRQAHVTKTTERGLQTELGDALEIRNHIKFRPLNDRVFKLLCEKKIGGEFTMQLLHTEIWWLTRRKFSLQFIYLPSETYFFIDRPFYLSHCLVNNS